MYGDCGDSAMVIVVIRIKIKGQACCFFVLIVPSQAHKYCAGKLGILLENCGDVNFEATEITFI
jgi:hypothetical protein